MKRFNVLFHNEVYKLHHRVLALIGVLLIVVLPILISVSFTSSDVSTPPGQDPQEAARVEMERILGNMEEGLKDAETWAEPGDPWLIQSRLEYERFSELVETRPDVAMTYYASEVVSILAQLDTMQEMDQQEDSLYTGYYTNLQFSDSEREKVYALGEKALESADLSAYYDFKQSLIELDRSLTAAERLQQLDALELEASIPDETNWSMSQPMVWEVRTLINDTIMARQSLEDGSNYLSWSQEAVTPLNEESIRNREAYGRYILENGLIGDAGRSYTSTATGTLGVMHFVVTATITIGLIILAGAIMSTEFETGSIKLLIIAPARRYKIYLAKLLSLAFTVFWLTVLGSIVIMLCQRFIVVGAPLTNTLLVKNGVVTPVNTWLFELARIPMDFIPAFAFTAFALMLSTLTRKSAAGVGGGLVLYFISTVLWLISVNNRWRTNYRWIPSLNFSFADRFVPGIAQALSMSNMTLNHYNLLPASFSVVFTAVFVGLMVWTALESFCKRDI